jgi:acyl-CoA synthetase (AMP-forming)/AMP-acid ligase II
MDAERLTVPGLLRRRVETDPHARFVVTEDAALTYLELDHASADVAARLVGAGVSKGTRVALLMANGIDWAVIAIATMRIGAVLVPLSTLLRPPELEAQLRAAGVEVLVCVRSVRGRDYLADLASISPALVPAPSALRVTALPRLRSIVLRDDGVWDNEPASARAADRSSTAGLVAAFGEGVRPADDMVIMFSSGSRGAPKAIVHTHGGALGATQSSLDARRIGTGERLYIPMPFFWMGGFGGGLMTAFVAGATLVTEAQPSPETTLRLLERERVTLFRGWPDQAAALASHPAFGDADLTSLKAGSLEQILPVELRGRPGGRPILFGMTETFGPYCADRLDQDLPPEKEGSLGRTFAGIEVQIVEPETGVPAAPGVVGEILLRGPNVMRGICGRTRSETFTADAFYRTGDLGRLDEDGYLAFVGRRDDMFKVSGANVFPSEVEAALEAIPYVRRAFVVDVGLGEARRVGAAVVLRPDDEHSAADLEADARRVLSSFKVPARWAVVGPDDVPRSATGKVDKDGLRRLVEEGKPGMPDS